MTENKSSNDKSERQFNQEHYDMLMRCSQAGNMSEWNDWRKANLKLRPQLQGADLTYAKLQGAELGYAELQGADLRGANLQGANLQQANLQRATLANANLQEADLWDANLQEATLGYARLQGANLGYANLQGVNLGYANLQGADLEGANLQEAVLWAANLQRANLEGAKLQGAHLINAKLQGASLWDANLQGAYLRAAKLQGADLRNALVDGLTNLGDCHIDRNTYFGGVPLGVPRMNPGLRTALEGNIRRIEWKKWYKKHKFLQWLVRPFWWVSDYGMSTGRVMATFFGLALAFGLIYYLFPDLICNLKEVRQTGEPPISVSGWMLLLRAVYFSVVTMTTLGFGDIYANPSSPTGHILLMFQVLLGYGLLGALVTRLAVLFNSLGPAQEYASTYIKQESAQQTDKRES